MSKCQPQPIDLNYRALYGKLFSSLVSRYGIEHASEIEDAIQNSFLKSLKALYSGDTPDHFENWLFIVARNDLLNQIKRKDRHYPAPLHALTDPEGSSADDLRLDTLLLLASAKTVSRQAKTVFLLKTIFGLNIGEISKNTLLTPDAIYKSNGRTRSRLRTEFGNCSIGLGNHDIGNPEIDLVEELLYSIFNIGFDSFSMDNGSIVDEDLCLEAIALARQLLRKYNRPSTSHLLALFCLHAARIPAKVVDGALTSFFKQDRDLWNMKLFTLGFDYLKETDSLNRYYLEALIASKYMTAENFDESHWKDLASLYELLSHYHPSPIVTLNLCYVLHKVGRTDDAFKCLADIESDLPAEHVYFSLVKAELLKATSPGESQMIIDTVADRLDQPVRKDFILGNGFITIQ